MRLLPLVVGALLGCGSTAGAQTMNASNETMALVGGTIYSAPSEESFDRGVVLIRGSRIVAVGTVDSVEIPDAARRLDCTGRTILAGFWNSHVHFFERKWSDAANLPAAELEEQLESTFATYGFTSVFDTGSKWANTRVLRERIDAGEVSGPTIRSTGEAMIAPGAMPADRVLAVMGIAPFPGPEIAEAEQAVDAARRFLDDGVDGIKLHLQPPPPPKPPFPEGAIGAAVEVAHHGGKPVFVHPHTGADVLTAAQLGVDIIAHTTPSSGAWDDETLAAMEDAGVALTPTLTLWKFFLRHDRASVQAHITRTAVAQLHAWVRRGGTVLFGTDLGAVDPDPSDEYALMAEAGMTFQQILEALTTAPAARFGVSESVGRIAPGFRADLVVLQRDPTHDVSALADVLYTVQAGQLSFDAEQ